jgi:anti-sigma B factor antagonist
METLIGVFVSPATASSAIAELQRIPLPLEAITFLTADPDSAQAARGGKFMSAFLGGIFGGTAGLSLGAAAATLVVPGVGPVLAIGIGAAALLGLGGAGAGAVLGAPASAPSREQQAAPSSTSPEDAQFFRNVLSKGRSIVVVRTDSQPDAAAACAVLDRLGIGTRRAGEPASSSTAAKAVVREVNGVAIVDLSGRITLGEGSAMLRDTVGALLEQGHKNIMLNLGRVTHIDSSGIGALVRALTTARSQGGGLKLVNVSLPVNEVLRITRLIGLFEVASDENTGTASFRASA